MTHVMVGPGSIERQRSNNCICISLVSAEINSFLLRCRCSRVIQRIKKHICFEGTVMDRKYFETYAQNLLTSKGIY